MTRRRNRKLGTARNAVGLAALAAVGPAYADNLLINPGFEAPAPTAIEDTLATGWTFSGDAKRAAHHVHGGVRSIWHQTFSPVGGGVTQRVGSLTAGAQYDFSGWHFFEPSYPNTEANILMTVNWLNVGGTSVGTAGLTITPGSITMTDVWLLFNVNDIVAPATTTQADIFFGWEGGGTVKGRQSAFVDDVIFDGPGQPPTGSVWANSASGDWNVSGNWSTGVVPNGVGASPQFLGAITAPRTVFTDSPVTVSALTFDNANAYTLTGSSSLTIDVASGAGNISVVSGSHKINLPLFVNDNTTADVGNGATLTIADPLVIASGSTLAKTGPGTLRIISTVTGSGPAALNVGGGNTQIDFGIGTPASASAAAEARIALIVSGSKAAFGANQTLRGLDAVTANAGDQEIDLAGKTARVYPANRAAEELSIYNDIKAARQSGSGRDGIRDSTSPGATHAVGVTDQSLDAHGDLSVFVRLTRTGDANVDGIVNLTDYNRVAANFGQNNMLWDNGDFTFDGVVNLVDYNALASNFGLLASPDGPTPDDWAALAAAIPEPMSGTTMMLAGILLAGQRRRRCQ